MFCVIFVFISMQQRVQQGLEDGARLPSLDFEKLRGENNSLKEEQQRLKKVCLVWSYMCKEGSPFQIRTENKDRIQSVNITG